MNKTIHELNSLTQAQADDEFIIYDVSEGESKKIQVQALNNPNYSTTEQKTGGTWIDGKPIYRKAGRISGSVSDTVIVDATLTQSYVDTVCNSFCQITTASNSIVIGGAYNGDTNNRLGLQIGANGLQKLSGITGAKNLVWWIEYTKTTD